jgi:glycerol-3-phosphate O-acyltransferase / dihydroxyacetone phosphate acyltransferase
VNAFYRALRAVMSWLLRSFYRIEPPNDPAGALSMEGPVMFVGNHPNGMVDPMLVGLAAERHVTFLAKAPLFSLPLLGWIMKRVGALPVYRKQDDPSQMGRNAGTLEAAAGALAQGRCITIFPEGRSHSEPQLQELKTGAARIALMAARQGAQVRIVPIGLTYSEKHRFRSAVRIDVGQPIEVAQGSDEHAAAVALTDRIFEALHTVTLNLGQWEDLPLLKTAEELYALKTGSAPRDPERMRAFARGMEVLREEQPERFARLKAEVLAVQRRLELVHAAPEELTLSYRTGQVAKFVARNLIGLALLPVFLGGMALFAVPYWIPPLVVQLGKVPQDIQATIKLVCLLVLAPLWLLLLTVLAWTFAGPGWGVAALVGTLPLALYTRYWLERRAAALHDARTFFVLGSRQRLKERLVAEGEVIAAQLQALVKELEPRVG